MKTVTTVMVKVSPVRPLKILSMEVLLKTHEISWEPEIFISLIAGE